VAVFMAVVAVVAVFMAVRGCLLWLSWLSWLSFMAVLAVFFIFMAVFLAVFWLSCGCRAAVVRLSLALSYYKKKIEIFFIIIYYFISHIYFSESGLKSVPFYGFCILPIEKHKSRNLAHF
jgi:hypothetical protein